MTTPETQSAAPKSRRCRFQYSLRTLLLFVTICSVVCGVAVILVDRATYLRVPDPQPAWAIDESRPWTIEFGRGSGRQGLDTVKIGNDSRVVLHRLTSTATTLICEQATINLPPQAVAEILATVSRDGLLRLHKEYHARNVADGSQWIFWIKQGDNQKAVYCDNYFPGAITDFAESLDAVLSRTG